MRQLPSCFPLKLTHVHSSLLKDVSLTCGAGEFVAIVGPNGAGKSTLLKTILGYLPIRGEITLGEHNLRDLPRSERAYCFAYLPQETILPWPITVRDVVRLGRSFVVRTSHFSSPFFPFSPSSEDQSRIDWLLEQCHLQTFQDRYVQNLSSGERARVFLARALAVDAPILLLDEPIAALDPEYQLIIMDLLQAYATEGRLVIMVLHDIPLALSYNMRVIAVRSGQLMGAETALTLLHDGILAQTFGVEFKVQEIDKDLFFNIASRKGGVKG